jgi:hypothetical protein
MYDSTFVVVKFGTVTIILVAPPVYEHPVAVEPLNGHPDTGKVNDADNVAPDVEMTTCTGPFTFPVSA